MTFGSLWGHFGDMMRIYGGLMGPKNGNVKNRWVSLLLFEGPRAPRVRQSREQSSGPNRLGGGRGRVNPPPCGFVWRF